MGDLLEIGCFICEPVLSRARVRKSFEWLMVSFYISIGLCVCFRVHF